MAKKLILNDLCIEILQKCPNNCIYCSSNSDLTKEKIIDFETIKQTISYLLNKCDIKADCGNIEIDTISIKENSTIKADFGNIDVNNTNDIYIDTDVDLGKTNINKNNRNSEITLKINCDCGNITINN